LIHLSEGVGMLRSVVQVYPTNDFKVYVYFDDGAIRLYDISPYLNKGVFTKISELSSFKERCTVMNGTLAWDLSGQFDPSKCIDIDPETIYAQGLSTSDPLSGKTA